MAEIRIYIEGGGDSGDSKARFRRGFGEFLHALRNLARSRQVGWNITACGSRDRAHAGFCTALRVHPDAVNVLVVDSEGPVSTDPWNHLRARDNWSHQGMENEHCHLMVQTMEAWFLADLTALREFYGQGFNEGSLPANPNVEDIDKSLLEPSLKSASRNTTKGEYHKGRHAPKILERLDVDVVRRRAPHCKRLFATLTNIISGI